MDSSSNSTQVTIGTAAAAAAGAGAATDSPSLSTSTSSTSSASSSTSSSSQRRVVSLTRRQARTLSHVSAYLHLECLVDNEEKLEVTIEKEATVEQLARRIEAEWAFLGKSDLIQVGGIANIENILLPFAGVVGELLEMGEVVHVITTEDRIRVVDEEDDAVLEEIAENTKRVIKESNSRTTLPVIIDSFETTESSHQKENASAPSLTGSMVVTAAENIENVIGRVGSENLNNKSNSTDAEKLSTFSPSGAPTERKSTDDAEVNFERRRNSRQRGSRASVYLHHQSVQISSSSSSSSSNASNSNVPDASNNSSGQDGVNTTSLQTSSDERFRSILHNKIALRYFREFCVREYSVENLLFWLDVETLRGLTTDSERRDMAEYIYDTYVSPSGPLTINLSHEIRADVSWPLPASPTPVDVSMFDDAQDHVYIVMKGHSFTRWERSPLFANYEAEMNADPKFYQSQNIDGNFAAHFPPTQRISRKQETAPFKGSLTAPFSSSAVISTSTSSLSAHSSGHIKHPSAGSFNNLTDNGSYVSKIAVDDIGAGRNTSNKFSRDISKEETLNRAMRSYFEASYSVSGYFNDTNRLTWAQKRRMQVKGKKLSHFFGIPMTDELIREQVHSAVFAKRLSLAGVGLGAAAGILGPSPYTASSSFPSSSIPSSSSASVAAAAAAAVASANPNSLPRIVLSSHRDYLDLDETLDASDGANDGPASGNALMMRRKKVDKLEGFFGVDRLPKDQLRDQRLVPLTPTGDGGSSAELLSSSAALSNPSSAAPGSSRPARHNSSALSHLRSPSSNSVGLNSNSNYSVTNHDGGNSNSNNEITNSGANMIISSSAPASTYDGISFSAQLAQQDLPPPTSNDLSEEAKRKLRDRSKKLTSILGDPIGEDGTPRSPKIDRSTALFRSKSQRGGGGVSSGVTGRNGSEGSLKSGSLSNILNATSSQYHDHSAGSSGISSVTGQGSVVGSGSNVHEPSTSSSSSSSRRLHPFGSSFSISSSSNTGAGNSHGSVNASHASRVFGAMFGNIHLGPKSSSNNDVYQSTNRKGIWHTSNDNDPNEGDSSSGGGVTDEEENDVLGELSSPVSPSRRAHSMDQGLEIIDILGYRRTSSISSDENSRSSSVPRSSSKSEKVANVASNPEDSTTTTTTFDSSASATQRAATAGASVESEATTTTTNTATTSIKATEAAAAASVSSSSLINDKVAEMASSTAAPKNQFLNGALGGASGPASAPSSLRATGGSVRVSTTVRHEEDLLLHRRNLTMLQSDRIALLASKEMRRRKLEKLQQFLGERLSMKMLETQQLLKKRTRKKKKMSSQQKESIRKRANKLEKVFGEVPPADMIIQPADSWKVRQRKSIQTLGYILHNQEDIQDLVQYMMDFEENERLAQLEAAASVNISKTSRQRKLNKLQKFFGNYSLDAELLLEQKILRDLERDIEENIEGADRESLRQDLESLRQAIRRRSSSQRAAASSSSPSGAAALSNSCSVINENSSSESTVVTSAADRTVGADLNGADKQQQSSELSSIFNPLSETVASGTSNEIYSQLEKLTQDQQEQLSKRSTVGGAASNTWSKIVNSFNGSSMRKKTPSSTRVSAHEIASALSAASSSSTGSNPQAQQQQQQQQQQKAPRFTPKHEEDYLKTEDENEDEEEDEEEGDDDDDEDEDEDDEDGDDDEDEDEDDDDNQDESGDKSNIAADESQQAERKVA